jgi:hypothetical protein
MKICIIGCKTIGISTSMGREHLTIGLGVEFDCAHCGRRWSGNGDGVFGKKHGKVYEWADCGDWVAWVNRDGIPPTWILIERGSGKAEGE